MLYVYDYNTIFDHSLIDLFPSKKIKILGKVQESNEEILKKVDKPGYFLFHINLTNSAPFYSAKQKLIQELIRRDVKPVNGFIDDISKTTIQNVCQFLCINNVVTNIQPNDSVIIKTNLNCYNLPEAKLSQQEKVKLGIPINIVKQDYKILKYKRVDFKNLSKDFVVEKFIENKKHLFYRVYKAYHYYVISEVQDNNKIKKLPDGIKRTNFYFNVKQKNYKESKLSSLIEQTEMLSQFLKFDYGTFDVVRSNNNEFYIVDVNLTPFKLTGATESFSGIIEHLQQAFKPYES